jgi:hypothetical protein
MKTYGSKKIIAIALVAAIAALACGCTVSNGLFVGMAHSSTDTSLSASYVSFDGSLARRVSLKAGDEVTFGLEGGDGLRAVAAKGGEELFDIADGAMFTAPEDSVYYFMLKGKAKDGSFSLTWKVDSPAGD